MKAATWFFFLAVLSSSLHAGWLRTGPWRTRPSQNPATFWAGLSSMSTVQASPSTPKPWEPACQASPLMKGMSPPLGAFGMRVPLSRP